MQLRFLVFIFIAFGLNLSAQNRINIIPKPTSVLEKDGEFIINSKTLVYISEPSIEKEANYFINYLESIYGLKLKLASGKPKKKNSILLNNLKSGDFENYELAITKKYIGITANADAGIFYGLQSLIQLLPVAKQSLLTVSCALIQDHPRYAWRGMHLDCSRHFFETNFIKKYIDFLATYKMNVFHWHLTDDQGWRIEIKKYPLLTKEGAWRKGSMIGPYSDNKFDSIRYGGFYTQNEIKEIVAYAAERHITIVPEIEMPGHALAALAAYPMFSCTGKPVEVGMKWGVETTVFCPSEGTFLFLRNILNEVMDLFPSKFIHIGGDEVLKDEWDSSVLCQQIMKDQGLANSHELQSYFIQRIEKIVNARGRSIIGWDEILEGGLAPNAAVMSWRGIEGGIAAAKQKHYVVMSPGSHCYFDHYQGKKEQEPLAIGGFTPLEKVYSYEPTPDTLSTEEATYILGAQANVWTEYITSSAQVEYMAMPRMAALAEVVWSKKEDRNYEDFYRRMQLHRSLLDARGINYSKTAFQK
jgi:hexosaminidase